MLLLQTEDTETELTSDSDEYVLVLLSQCEQKMQSLNEELVGNDLPAILKEMEQEEVSGYNTLCDTIAYFTIPYLTIQYAMIPFLTIPYLTIPSLTATSLTIPYLIIPYAMTPFPTIPYLTIPFFTIPHP